MDRLQQTSWEMKTLLEGPHYGCWTKPNVSTNKTHRTMNIFLRITDYIVDVSTMNDMTNKYAQLSSEMQSNKADN